MFVIWAPRFLSVKKWLTGGFSPNHICASAVKPMSPLGCFPTDRGRMDGNVTILAFDVINIYQP